MPPFTKPTKLPEWASGDAADIVEPTSGEKAQGWVAGTPGNPTPPPPAPYFNWLMGGDFGYYPWLQYVSTFEQNAFIWTEQQTFASGLYAEGPAIFDDEVQANGGLAVGGGATVAGGASVTGGLTADTASVTGAVSGATGTFSGQVSAGSFAELELTAAYGATEIATALGGLYVSGNGQIDPASISSSNSGSAFTIIKTANGSSSPMQVAASFDVPTGATITQVSATVTNGASSAVTLTVAAYLRTATATRTNIVTQGATANVPPNAANFTTSFNGIATPGVWATRVVPAAKGTRVEVIIDTGLLPSGFGFNFLAIAVNYSQTKPRP